MISLAVSFFICCSDLLCMCRGCGWRVDSGGQAPVRLLRDDECVVSTLSLCLQYPV